jgi:hypothetical protein
LAASAAIFFIMACKPNVSKTGKSDFENAPQHVTIQHYETTILPQVLSIVESGDIVTRLGNDMTSHMLSLTNQSDKDFSHCGIAIIENDTAFIYHIMGGEWNPDQKMKREPLIEFAHPTQAKKLGIFKPLLDTEKMESLLFQIVHLYKTGIIFDLDFDWNTDERQYCTEMVAKAIILSVGHDKWLPTSMFQNKKYVSLENLYNNSLVTEKKRIYYSKEAK